VQVIATIKVVTILLTAIFGIIGSFFNFRDRRGRVTATGWTVLFGVFFAGGSAALLQLYSDREQENSVITILSQINRSLNPLPGLIVTFSLQPNWAEERFKSYFEEVEAGFSNETSVGSRWFFYEPSNHSRASILDYTVCDIDVILLFFRVPVDVQHFSYSVEDSREDLRVDVYNPCKYSAYRILGLKPGNNVTWEYDVRDGKLRRLEFEVSNVKIDTSSDSWRSNSKIVSLQDLLGAQLIIILDAPGMPVNPKDVSEQQIVQYRQLVQLSNLLLRLPSGIVLNFDSDNLVAWKGRDGLALYSYNFPSKLDALIESTRYDMFKKLNKYDQR
jgi:hypothetical protein